MWPKQQILAIFSFCIFILAKGDVILVIGDVPIENIVISCLLV